MGLVILGFAILIIAVFLWNFVLGKMFGANRSFVNWVLIVFAAMWIFARCAP